MKLENKYDGIIVRYLLHEATVEEENFIFDWMRADEKNRIYVEELKNILQLISLDQELDQINVDQEWEHFRRGITDDQHNSNSFYTYETEDVATIAEKPNRKATIYKIAISTALVASLILVMGLQWSWFNRPTDDSVKGLQTQTSGKGVYTDSIVTNFRHELNMSSRAKQFTLPDSSEIVLSNNSEVTYQELVQGHRRDVYLKGMASFKVAKDKTKPFTVYTGDIATTAIGTEFTISSVEKEKYITVKLEEGKVVIKLMKRYNNRKNKEVKDFYLWPGQELIYDKKGQTARVKFFSTKKPVSSKINNMVTDNSSIPDKDNPSIPKYKKGSWFMFNNQPLSDVFDELQDMYKVKIVYAKKDTKNKYFVGTFDRSESLETILKKIAVLNNLTITKEKGTFTIRRSIKLKR